MKSTLYHISKWLVIHQNNHSYMNHNNNIRCINKVDLRNKTTFLFIVENYNKHGNSSPESSSSDSKWNRPPGPSSSSLQQPPSITNTMISQTRGRISTIKEIRVSWNLGKCMKHRDTSDSIRDNLSIINLSLLLLNDFPYKSIYTSPS